MDVETVNIADLKPGQKVTIDIAAHEVIMTKLDEPKKFSLEDWVDDEIEVYIMEDVIEEDGFLHYSYRPITLEEGLKANEGKFGKDLVMWDFLAREVEGIEMDDEEGGDAAED